VEVVVPNTRTIWTKFKLDIYELWIRIPER